MSGAFHYIRSLVILSGRSYIFDAARHTSMNCPTAQTRPEPRPPARLHCFPHTLVIVRSSIGSASVAPHEAGSQTYSSPHVSNDDSQQTIYNLQPARNVFYKKGGPRPDPTRLICVFFRPKPAGLVRFVGSPQTGCGLPNWCQAYRC